MPKYYAAVRLDLRNPNHNPNPSELKMCTAVTLALGTSTSAVLLYALFSS